MFFASVASVLVAIIAVVLMIAGFNNKDFETYFAKAVQICTQCIGIG